MEATLEDATLFLALSFDGGCIPPKFRPSVDVFPDEHAALVRQLEMLDEIEPVHVNLIEYSTRSVQSILEHLAQCESVKLIRLLVANPNTVLEKRQAKEKIVPGLEWVRLTFPVDVAIQRGLRIKVYDQAASPRGRSFGGQAVALWIYTRDRREDDDFWGHTNFLLTAGAQASQGMQIIRWFDGVHGRLWDDAKPLAAVHRQQPILKEAEEWIETVSSPESRYGR